LEVLFPYIFLK